MFVFSENKRTKIVAPFSFVQKYTKKPDNSEYPPCRQKSRNWSFFFRFFTTHFQPFASTPTDILEDDSINCVVELMGGVTHAKDVVFKALKKGKHVVTANKALLAQLLPEVRCACCVLPECRYDMPTCSKRMIPRCLPPLNPVAIFEVGCSTTTRVPPMNAHTTTKGGAVLATSKYSKPLRRCAHLISDGQFAPCCGASNRVMI